MGRSEWDGERLGGEGERKEWERRMRRRCRGRGEEDEDKRWVTHLDVVFSGVQELVYLCEASLHVP